MTPGLRKFKSATLRVAIPESLPLDMQDGIREILDVKSGNPRKGQASSLMRNVCAEADADSAVLMLHVNQFDDGLSNEQLVKFYGKFDFNVIQTEPATLLARQPK